MAAHSRELESKYGVPTAPISSARFAEYLAMDAQNHGVTLRFSFAPYPLVGRPREALRGYVEGNDPCTGEPLMPQIIGALSPFNHANSVIGRSWTLLSIKLADARPGDTFMGSLGHNLNYNNMCFAENEERSIWEPFHVRHGFKKEEMRPPSQIANKQ